MAGAGEARQPDLRRQLQPAAARRPGARQRQDHPGAGERVPRRRLERHQGGLGPPLGRAAGARHRRGTCSARMEEAVDGEYQVYKAQATAPTSASTSSTRPELKAMVADMSDEDIWNLNRGGHDPFKVYAAYQAASQHQGQPTVILAKTIKGYGMGESGEAQNTTHQQKKLVDRRDPQLPRSLPAAGPGRPARAAPLPQVRGGLQGARVPDGPPRRARRRPAPAPPAGASRCRCRRSPPSRKLLEGTGERAISTTMAFVQLLQRAGQGRRASAGAWCPSSPTSRAPSAWRGCSASSASGARSASSTRRRTPTS